MRPGSNPSGFNFFLTKFPVFGIKSYVYAQFYSRDLRNFREIAYISTVADRDKILHSFSEFFKQITCGTQYIFEANIKYFRQKVYMGVFLFSVYIATVNVT